MASTALTINQGTTWEVRWPVVNPDGTPIDLTGWSVRAQVRASIRSADVLHEWTTALGNASIIESSVSLKVAADVSSAWTWTEGVYDVELFHPDGRVSRIAQGSITVDPEVTR